MVRYVEVPVKQQVVREVRVPKVVKVQKRVPQVQVQYKDVHVPKIEFKDKPIYTDDVRENVIYRPKDQYIDIPQQFVEYVPQVEKRVIEKCVSVPSGDVQEIYRPHRVYDDVPVPYYQHSSQTVPVAQMFEPSITVSTEAYNVPSDVWVPKVVPFDIYIPKLVDAPLYDNGQVEVEEYPVNVPWPHMRHLEQHFNPSLGEDLRVPQAHYHSTHARPTTVGYDHGVSYPRTNGRASRFYPEEAYETYHGPTYHGNTYSGGGVYTNGQGHHGRRRHNANVESARTWFPAYGKHHNYAPRHLVSYGSHPAVVPASYTQHF
ncbi:hypothetical protein GNI_176040 [Gregarina niphandrodes]|uniref:Inner membrane complex protein n=1 Tax=Gregarina niphandrodes TaxID=110365 RepID=A0A023AXH5_GRENI|nr:hypothetical protein GNI_176040 [Gregarina niphandrodes]EZG43342.1 hypothetical protein GNI_176040 [Gregarina niphandrodes]|eukprot:XP_011133391.1 hypothetical protein GNI_176040 [Gregarina niphandrodes]